MVSFTLDHDCVCLCCSYPKPTVHRTKRIRMTSRAIRTACPRRFRPTASTMAADLWGETPGNIPSVAVLRAAKGGGLTGSGRRMRVVLPRVYQTLRHTKILYLTSDKAHHTACLWRPVIAGPRSSRYLTVCLCPCAITGTWPLRCGRSLEIVELI
jgi:hypothetical protein